MSRKIRVFVDSMPESELVIILESARIALSDTEYLEHLSSEMDLAYDELLRITDNLIEFMEDDTDEETTQ